MSPSVRPPASGPSGVARTGRERRPRASAGSTPGARAVPASRQRAQQLGVEVGGRRCRGARAPRGPGCRRPRRRAGRPSATAPRGRGRPRPIRRDGRGGRRRAASASSWTPVVSGSLATPASARGRPRSARSTTCAARSGRGAGRRPRRRARAARRAAGAQRGRGRTLGHRLDRDACRRRRAARAASAAAIVGVGAGVDPVRRLLAGAVAAEAAAGSAARRPELRDGAHQTTTCAAGPGQRDVEQAQVLAALLGQVPGPGGGVAGVPRAADVQQPGAGVVVEAQDRRGRGARSGPRRTGT